MSENDDLTTAIFALGAIGLGIAGFKALSKWDAKAKFLDALEGALADHGLSLVAAEVGRGTEGQPAWFVTVNRPRVGLGSYQASFPRETDLYSAKTLNQLLDRLLAAMKPDVPLWQVG